MTGSERTEIIYNLMANGVNAAGNAARDEVAVAAAIGMLIVNLERLHGSATLRQRIFGLLEQADA